ncbi:MAG: CoA ester lyase [Rhizobiaceae bacterium]|nr:CoA ester lyase [Rhizobiaceae bacterium]
MSFTKIPDRAPRLNRSQLAVPASQARMIEKAANSEADIVFLDLEDAVAPADKEAARQNVVDAVNQKDWGRKSVSYRVNGLDTHYMYRDLIDVVEACGDRLDLIMIPKVGAASDIYAVDMLLTQIEAAKGFEKRIGIEALIESALGMQNIAAIAQSSPRLESLHFGAGDYSASLHAKTTHIGGTNSEYAILSDADESGHRVYHLGDQHHHALSSLVIAARANGLRPIDSAFGDFSDPEGYKASAQRAAAMGCEGKWAIHPSQIALANEIMGPDAEEVDRAKRILSAMNEAAMEGKGAVTFEGRMIDAANIRQAEMLVRKAEMIGNG